MTESEYISKWQDCLTIIRDNIGNDKFETWFSKAKAVGYAANKLTISVPSQFFYETYENNFYDLIRFALTRVYGQEINLRYNVALIQDDKDSHVELESHQKSRLLANKTATYGMGTQERDGVTYDNFDSQLNPRYNLENYCVGKSNKLAYTIAEYICSNPGKSEFNPFFLYGDVGVGKTHLMQAIGIRIKEQYPKARVLYTTVRRFSNHYQKDAMTGDVPKFINWYQSMDVLLIDDLQELTGKEKTMNALYPIFNHLHQNGRKLIFTSDRPPMELEGITDRLIDRFRCGITEHLPKPDLELRRKILRFKSETNGLSLPERIIDMIAEQCTGSIREIEGIVMSIITRSIMMNAPITEELAAQVLCNAMKTKKRVVNFDMIVEATADRFNLNPDVVYSKSRVRDIADARQVIMYLARKLTNLSSPAIGSRLNRRHTTVIHGIQTVTDRLTVCKELQDMVADIEKNLLN